MKRDWIWGWVAALPSIIIAFLAIKSTSLYSENPSTAVGLALALATTISTGVLWMKNRHSRLKILQSGGDIELAIRPIDAFVRAAYLFLAILGGLVFVSLVDEGRAVVEWGLGIIFVGVVAYLWSLKDTAYRQPE